MKRAPWRAIGLASVAVMMLLAASCGDDGAGVDTGSTDVSADGAASAPESETSTSSRTSDSDVLSSGGETSSTLTTPPSVTGLPDETVLCTSDAECEPGWCARRAGMELGFCTTVCREDEDCPEEWDCILLTASGRDAEFVCIPQSLCIDEDEDGYGFGPGCAGPDCDDTDPNVNPGMDERCDGRDTNCDGRVDVNPIYGEVNGAEVRIGDDCTTDAEGICAEGRWACDNGRTYCAPRRAPATEERCDAFDNTCDGFVDRDLDGNLLQRSCFTGEDPEAAERGECRAGLQTCEGGEWGAGCAGQVLPRDERCDELDWSCSGDPHDVPAERLQSDRENCGVCFNVCDEHLDCRSGECRCATGLSNCGEECVDTQTDRRFCGSCETACEEGFACESGECVRIGCEPGITRPCDNACGEGTQTCIGGAEGWGPCSAPTPGSTRDCASACGTGRETCGAEGWEGCDAPAPGAQRTCSTGCGSGVETCGAEGWVGCDAPGPGATRACQSPCGIGLETCNGDEWEGCDAPAMGQIRSCSGVCGSGVETCGFDGWLGCDAPGVGDTRPCFSSCGSGVETCASNGSWVSCTAPANGDTRPCTNTNEWGTCTGGEQACGADGWGSCSAQVPRQETCNLQDDNCDGMVDSGLSCTRPIHRYRRPGNGAIMFSNSLTEQQETYTDRSFNEFYLYESSAGGNAVPFYRCFNDNAVAHDPVSSWRHFLTADVGCEGIWGPNTSEQILGYISPVERENTTPLWRLYFGSPLYTHIYTIDPDERDQLVADGWNLEGLVAHVWTE